MSYRIFLQTDDGSTFEKTETGSRAIAQAVFTEFLERHELDGKPVSAHLTHLRTALAVHRFDAAAGQAENWQNRAHEIAWPKGTGQAGRPAELEGGVRKNVFLDAASIAKAKKIGKGNLSVGIRIALSRV